MKKSRYIYLAAYQPIHGGSIGRTVFYSSSKIRTAEDVQKVESQIAKDINVVDVVLISLVFLDKEWGVWDWFKTIVETVLLSFCIMSLIASIFG